MLIVVKFMDVNTKTTNEMIMVMKALKNDSVKLNSNQFLNKFTRDLVRTIVGFAGIEDHWSLPVDSMHAGIPVKLNRIVILWFCGLTDASLYMDRFWSEKLVTREKLIYKSPEYL